MLEIPEGVEQGRLHAAGVHMLFNFHWIMINAPIPAGQCSPAGVISGNSMFP